MNVSPVSLGNKYSSRNQSQPLRPGLHQQSTSFGSFFHMRDGIIRPGYTVVELDPKTMKPKPGVAVKVMNDAGELVEATAEQAAEALKRYNKPANDAVKTAAKNQGDGFLKRFLKKIV